MVRGQPPHPDWASGKSASLDPLTLSRYHPGRHHVGPWRPPTADRDQLPLNTKFVDDIGRFMVSDATGATVAHLKPDFDMAPDQR
jgi:hypothetical protein